MFLNSIYYRLDKWINVVDMKKVPIMEENLFFFHHHLYTVCFNPINKFWKDDVPASRWQNEKWT